MYSAVLAAGVEARSLVWPAVLVARGYYGMCTLHMQIAYRSTAFLRAVERLLSNMNSEASPPCKDSE